MYKPKNTLKPHPNGLRPIYASGHLCTFIGYFHGWSASQRFGTYNCSINKHEKIEDITLAIVENERGEIHHLANDRFQFVFLDMEDKNHDAK